MPRHSVVVSRRPSPSTALVLAPGDRTYQHPGGLQRLYWPERIRTARERKGWSQLKLAYQCQVTPTTLSRLECGKGSPRLDTLERIAFALDVSVAWIIGDRGAVA